MTTFDQNYTAKLSFGKLLTRGVIFEVTNGEEAAIAEGAGAVAVLVTERFSSEILEGSVTAMPDPLSVQEVMDRVSVPVGAKVRIGHSVEAEIVEQNGCAFLEESLTPISEMMRIDPTQHKIPVLTEVSSLADAMIAISQGSTILRTKGAAGSGNISEAVAVLQNIFGELQELGKMLKSEVRKRAKEMGISLELLEEVVEKQTLPVVLFAAGGVATPADAALLMRMGAQGIVVGSGVFRAENPEARARAIIEAVAFAEEREKLLAVSAGLGKRVGEE